MLHNSSINTKFITAYSLQLTAYSLQLTAYSKTRIFNCKKKTVKKAFRGIALEKPTII